MGPKSRANWQMGCWKKGSCANFDKRCKECNGKFSEYKEKEETNEQS